MKRRTHKPTFDGKQVREGLVNGFTALAKMEELLAQREQLLGHPDFERRKKVADVRKMLAKQRDNEARLRRAGYAR